jgi:hypothetical protein
MAVSEAKLEANRRNAQKSTGPRTEEGKKNSRLEMSVVLYCPWSVVRCPWSVACWKHGTSQGGW